MKTATKYIRIVQGVTTLVYRYEVAGWCAGVQVTHREPKPVLFRKAAGRRFKAVCD